MLLKRFKSTFANQYGKTDAPMAGDAGLPTMKLPSAEETLVAELAGLTEAGSGFIPPAEPSSDPIPAEPKIDPSMAKVLAFIRICHLTSGLTYREISGGCDLPIADVKSALESLVTSGAVKHSDEAEPNYRRYSLTASEPVQSTSAESYVNPEAAWAAEARKSVLDAEAANRPPIVRATVPPLEEIVLPEPAKPLTAEERRLHNLLIPRGRVSRNQQEAIKR